MIAADTRYPSRGPCRGMAAASAAAQRWGARLPHGDAHDGAAAGSSELVSDQVSEIVSPSNTPRSIRIDEAEAERAVAAQVTANTDETLAIRGHQRSSSAIKCNQVQSDETLARARRQGAHPPQSPSISLNLPKSQGAHPPQSASSDACSGCQGAVSGASLHAPSVALLHLPQLHLSKQGSSVGGTSVSRASDCL